MTVVLQSYSVENIGRSNRNYILGQIATHFTPTYNKNWKIFSNNTDPIVFTRPFWLHFIDNNFHYLPFRFISANYSNFLNFSPSSLFIEGLNLFFIQNIQFKIKNTMKEDILLISEVTTFSREVFSTEFEEIKIEPQNECVLNLYVCPHRSGTFSTVVLISTNKGTIPYSITYRSVTSPVDSFISTIFYQSSLIPANITIKVPVALQSKKVAVFYDSSILTPDQQTQTSMSYKFTVERLNPGFYISFLNFFSPTIGRNYPIFLSVSSKLLQSNYPVILFNTITTQTETIEMEVKMINPTNLIIHIISVHLASESPSNVRISHTKPPLDCDPQSITLVGKIIMTGARPGEVNTMVIVMYEADGFGVQSVEIPVKGYVSIGSFQLPDEKIEIVGLIEKTYRFHFINHFKEAVFVLAAHAESDCFSIEKFEVFIVNPNETSQDIVITFNPQKINSNSNSDTNKVDSILYIETNITRITIPISGYNGNISISKSGATLASYENNQITFNYSSVLVNSEKDVSFYITNPNPVNFHVNIQSNTSLLTLLSPNCITLNNFSMQKVNLKLKFNSPLDKQPNIHSNLFFLLGSSRFDIDINWNPFYGEFQLRASVYKIVFGLKQNISIGLKSTYRIPVQVKQIECSTDCLVNKNIVFEPDNDYEIYRLEFTFDSSFLSKFNNSLNSNDILELPFEFTFSMNDGFIIKSYLPIKFEYAYFPNKSYAFGLIPSHSRSNGNLTAVNFFDVPVVFEIKISPEKEKTFYVKTLKKQLIKPGGFFQLEFTFTPDFAGHRILVIPVDTNVTVFPFYIELDSEAIEPIFSLVNINEKKKDQTSSEKMDYENENDRVVDSFNVSLQNSESIEFSVFLKNEGSISIPIEKLTTNSKMKIKSKCGQYLPINSRCEIDFVLNPKVFSHSVNYAVLEVVSCNIVKTINITVLIDEKTVFHIKLEKFFKCAFVLIIALLPISLKIIELNSKNKKINNEFKWRIAEIAQEIERLSVSKRSSVSIQTSTPEKKPFVGRWTCPDLFKICPVSKNGIEAMTKMIGNLK